MEVQRLISWYRREDEELEGEINIDFINIEVLKKIFNPPEDDPLMYNFYWVERQEAEELKKYLEFDFKFDKYIYQVECFQAGT
jgi:hypothetical protein